MEKVIMHIDVNSAYLSWEAAYRLQHGASVDRREIPSVMCGAEESRHGIVLAKSIPAKNTVYKPGDPFLRPAEMSRACGCSGELPSVYDVS